MKDFTLSDYPFPKDNPSERLTCLRKFTGSLGKLILLASFLLTTGVFSQVIIEGAVPVKTPIGGFAVDGDARAGVPDPTYNLVGDWFFEDFNDQNNTDPGGIFRRDLINETLIPIYDFTYFLQDSIPMGNMKDPTIFTTDAKIDQDPNTYTWGEGSSPPKNEIQNVAAHFTYGDDQMLDYLGNPGNPDDLWVLFAADRAVTNGDSYIDFEFLQDSLTMTGLGTGSGGFISKAPAETGGRNIGDLLVTVGYGNGGGVATVAILRWESDGSGGYHYDLKDINDYQGLIYATTNKSITNVPFDAYGKDYYEINQWVEGAVNLTKVFEENEDPCISLSTLFVRTRSSGESGTAQLKDFPVGPIQLGLDLTPPAPELTDVESCGPWSGTLDATGCEGTVKWYDAETDGTLLYTGASYTPINPITETTSFWVSCTVNECEGPRAEVTVTIYEIPDFDVTNLESCEEGETGGASFDLNDAISNEDMGTLTFYSSNADAMVPENAIDPIDVTVLLTDSAKTFWARLDNDDDGDENCHTIKFFTVTVYDNPDLVVTDLEDCEDGETGYQSFDLNDGVTTADGNVTFYPTEDDAINETNALTPEEAADVSVPLTGATYWVRSENTEDDTCYTIDSFDITVYDNPDLVVTDLEDCEDGETGYQSFDLNDGVTTADGNVTFYPTENDAINETNALTAEEA
uniref:immunoglobulin domain-containing protein n=1 Tax=Salegentibacter sediminis TaxID=1930251 RepID=UPI0012FFCAC0